MIATSLLPFNSRNLLSQLFAVIVVVLLGSVAMPQDPATTDPLFQKPTVTFEDLQQSLADPQLRDYVIERHFGRAPDLSESQIRQILDAALRSPSLPAKRQAVQKLLDRGLLNTIVEERTAAAGPKADLAFKFGSETGLLEPPPPVEVMSDSYIRGLVQDLRSQDATKRFSADSQLSSMGPDAIPFLLDALNDPELAEVAAGVLGRIMAVSSPVQMYAAEPEMIKEEAIRMEALPKAYQEQWPTAELVRDLDEDKPRLVRVHFGTNRAIEKKRESPDGMVLGGAAAVFVVLGVSIFELLRSRKTASGESARSFGCGSILLTCLLAGLAFWGFQQINTGWRELYSEHQGVGFAGRREANGQIHYGYCEVSIPPTHTLGRVERPLLGREDEQEHVVLKLTKLQEDQIFFSAVKERLKTVEDGQCFVFVHGYNVTFDDAARRTAQIHYDLEFDGVPIFFSWPSRGSLRHYFSDRNEILVSREAIRQFLTDVASKTGAKKIHVIAHSMGADAVCQAIAELEETGPVFEQVILAAPDIDADVFEFQLLPQMKAKARRTTLYCSRNDLALHASYHFNDSRRAGDSSERLVLTEGLDTVDASDMDTELLGHSYYGSCQPLIDDVRKILTANLPPPERDLEEQPMGQSVPAWIFRPDTLSQPGSTSGGDPFAPDAPSDQPVTDPSLSVPEL